MKTSGGNNINGLENKGQNDEAQVENTQPFSLNHILNAVGDPATESANYANVVGELPVKSSFIFLWVHPEWCILNLQLN